MCLLNGDVSGTLTAQTVFDSFDEQDEKTKEWSAKKIPIKDMIRNSVHQYAGEPYHNIIISDLDDKGLELLEYRYDTPMYLFRKVTCNDKYEVVEEDNTYTGSVIFNPETKFWYYSGARWARGTSLEEDIVYDSYLGNLSTSEKPTLVCFDEIPYASILEEGPSYYYVTRFAYGETVGYRLTDVIYPSELVLNVGDAITSLYDKLVTMLGDFEYFYDVDGRFIFQKKKNYLETAWTPSISTEEEEVYYDGSETESAYVFSGVGLFTALSNSPTLNNLKNDYVVWGERETDSSNLAFHMRYSIAQKPRYYKTIDGVTYYTEDFSGKSSISGDAHETDWREIIYQMAKDYNAHNAEDDYAIKLIENGRAPNGENFYINGRTGYEPYYIDLQGFWRQLYYPSEEEWEDDKEAAENNNTLDEFTASYGSVYADNYREDGWNRNVYENPSVLNYWLDFIESNELAQYDVLNIGVRSKVVNDTGIKSIYYRDTPSIIFLEDENSEKDESKTGYKCFQVTGYEGMFSISSQGKSAKDEIDSLLYNYSYAQESISVSAVPIYYLQPNTRITINDDKTKINGDYVISKITIPLTYNGTMTLSATKAPDRIM